MEKLVYRVVTVPVEHKMAMNGIVGLSDAVNKAILDGWRPWGSMQVFTTSLRVFFTQPMVIGGSELEDEAPAEDLSVAKPKRARKNGATDVPA